MKFAFILAEKATFKVSAMCRLLGVTRQGFYAYASRPVSARITSDAQLARDVREVFASTGETYGSPRVLAELKRQGHAVGKRRVCRRSAQIAGG